MLQSSNRTEQSKLIEKNKQNHDVIIKRTFGPTGQTFMCSIFCEDSLKLTQIMTENKCSESTALDIALANVLEENAVFWDFAKITRNFKAPDWISILIKALEEKGSKYIRIDLKILVDNGVDFDIEETQDEIEKKLTELGATIPLVFIRKSKWGKHVEITRIPGEAFHAKLIDMAKKAGIDTSQYEQANTDR